jgi:hypothetical protein
MTVSAAGVVLERSLADKPTLLQGLPDQGAGVGSDVVFHVRREPSEFCAVAI